MVLWMWDQGWDSQCNPEPPSLVHRRRLFLGPTPEPLGGLVVVVFLAGFKYAQIVVPVGTVATYVVLLPFGRFLRMQLPNSSDESNQKGSTVYIYIYIYVYMLVWTLHT